MYISCIIYVLCICFDDNQILKHEAINCLNIPSRWLRFYWLKFNNITAHMVEDNSRYINIIKIILHIQN